MQTVIKNQLTLVLNFVLAFSIATAPFAAQFAYAQTPVAQAQSTQPGTVKERLKVWASWVTRYFRAEDPKTGKTVDANWTVTVVEGNNEVETTGAVLDNAQGPVIVLADAQEDQAIIDRVQQGPTAGNTQVVQVTTPNKRYWKSAVKKYVGDKLDASRNKVKALAKDHSFRAVMLSLAGNATGFGITVWMTNTTLATGAALSAVVFATGVFSNMSIRGHEPYAILLNKGANGVYRAANFLARAIGRNAAPAESVLRRIGMLMAGIGVNIVPTALTFAITQDAILSAGMMFATLRNSWDIPVDVKLQDLYERGFISYETKKKLMGGKSFVGPIVDNLAVSNFSIGGFPIAQTVAFALALGGAVSVFASEKIGKAFLATGGHARTIASKSKQFGVRIANSFGGGARRVATALSPRMRQAQIEEARKLESERKRNCVHMLVGAVGDYEPASWASRRHVRAADDVN